MGQAPRQNQLLALSKEGYVQTQLSVALVKCQQLVSARKSSIITLRWTCTCVEDVDVLKAAQCLQRSLSAHGAHQGGTVLDL
jgi:hypothetical protein